MTSINTLLIRPQGDPFSIRNFYCAEPCNGLSVSATVPDVSVGVSYPGRKVSFIAIGLTGRSSGITLRAKLLGWLLSEDSRTIILEDVLRVGPLTDNPGLNLAGGDGTTTGDLHESPVVVVALNVRSFNGMRSVYLSKKRFR